MKSWGLSPELRFKVSPVFMKMAKAQFSLGYQVSMNVLC